MFKITLKITNNYTLSLIKWWYSVTWSSHIFFFCDYGTFKSCMQNILSDQTTFATRGNLKMHILTKTALFILTPWLIYGQNLQINISKADT